MYLGNLTGYLKYDAFLINQLFQIGLQIQKQGTEFLNQLRVSHLPDCCYLLLHRYFLYSFARMLSVSWMLQVCIWSTAASLCSGLRMSPLQAPVLFIWGFLMEMAATISEHMTLELAGITNFVPRQL